MDFETVADLQQGWVGHPFLGGEDVRKPRCFVAMALGRAETESLFTRSIRPVLTDLGITGVVINRREDNRDITTQVMEQLDRADLCIADLTYARPSVYFEAGYAERKVAVVYTARQDHLERGQGDDTRVHFDLEHRAIIPWRDPDSEEFRARLKRRIRETFLRGWLAEQGKTHELAAAREAFAGLSERERRVFMLESARACLVRMGYQEVEGTNSVHPVGRVLATGHVHHRTNGATFTAVMCFAPSGSVEGLLRSFIDDWSFPLTKVALANVAKTRWPITDAHTAVMVMTERPVRREGIARSLVHWRPERAAMHWVDAGANAVTLQHGVRHWACRLAVVDGLRSEGECRDRVGAILVELVEPRSETATIAPPRRRGGVRR